MKKGKLSLFILTLVLSIVFSVCTIPVDAKTPTPTITPTDLVATAVSPTQINLSWNAPTQNYGKVITGYKIEERLNYGVYDTLVYNTGSTITTYSLTGLTTSVTYTYRVSAVYSDDTSTDPSNPASATPTSTTLPTSPPSLPLSSPTTNVKFDFIPSDGTTLSGVVLSQNDYLELQYRKDSRSLVIDPIPTSESTNNNISGVIVYQNNHLASDTVPGPLIGKVAAFDEINLSWLPPVETYGQHIVGYKIEWKRAPGDYVVIDDNTGNSTTQYSVAKLVPGATYTYRVSAVYLTRTTSNPSNEVTVILLLPPTPAERPAPHPDATSSPNVTSQTPVPTAQVTNVLFDFIAPDGTMLNGVILTQSDYQQLVVIKDPRSILSNVQTTSDTINNSLAGLIKYQELHIPKQTVQQTSSNNTPVPEPKPQENNSLVQGIATYVIALLSVGAITWFAKTKLAKKIVKDYHFTLEKYQDGDLVCIRIRNSGETIENSVIMCEKEVCIWNDTHLNKPRHIYEGSISTVTVPEGYADKNPLLIVKSGKKVLRKTRLDDMAHG